MLPRHLLAALPCLLPALPQEAPGPPAVPESAAPKPTPTNRLARETSPYLLQHAHNPVDWYPWGEEAFARARAENRPIFLSIGYSACHWCHVMERESFEDPGIAAFLNEHFVSIKVDREERPDVDDLYMAAVQRMTGSGGWPLSVFLTPDLRPFWGGTYFPPRARGGRPGFLEILQALADAWEHRRDEVLASAERVDQALALRFPEAPEDPIPGREELARRDAAWVAAFARDFDRRFGGFGPAPKFPRAEDLRFLLAAARRSGLAEAREMAVLTLHRMAAGGMYDQLAGGFHRYSTDAAWQIPHFEKMLYDQGTLVPAYLDAWRATGDPFFARIARECCDWVLREMRDPGGAFWSSTDADSEGEEGRFFTWTPAELAAVLGPERARFAAALYGVTKAGTFEGGRSVLLAAAAPAEAARAAGVKTEDPEGLARQVRADLLAARKTRVPPATDDKVLLGWNGLMVDALARAGRELGEARYVEAAAGAAAFLAGHLRTDEGWRRSWRDGRARHRAVLEDLAWACRGFLSLFQATGEERWFLLGREMAEVMVADHWDPGKGLFHDTDGRDPHLRHRLASPWDGATPSPNAVALECMAMLAAFEPGEARWRETAERGFAAVLQLVEGGNPRAFTASLRALELAVEEPRTAVVVGTGDAESLAGWRRALHAPGAPPLLVVLRPAPARADTQVEILAGRTPRDGRATLYLCRGSTCLPPETDPGRLAVLLGD